MALEIQRVASGDESDQLSLLCSVAHLLPMTLASAGISAPALGSAVDGVEFFRGILESKKQDHGGELVEQAKKIIKGCGDRQNIDAELGDKGAKQQPPGHRPGLGRRKAQFSLKAASSQEVSKVDFSVLKSIEDPEEYIATLDRLEKAEKEIKRLRGEAPETTQTMEPTARKRRPGIPGRKSTYKFSVPSTGKVINAFGTSLTHDKALVESAAATIDTPSTEGVEQFHASESVFSVAEKENLDDIPEKENLHGVLDDLLLSFEDLNEDREDLLQPKSHNLGKAELPNVSSTLNNSPRRNREIMIRSSHVHISDKIVRSPLAAISALTRRISLKCLPSDCYTELPVDSEEDSPNTARQNEKSPLSTQDLSHRNISVSAEGVVDDRRLTLENRDQPLVVESGKSRGRKTTVKKPKQTSAGNTGNNNDFGDNGSSKGTGLPCNATTCDDCNAISNDFGDNSANKGTGLLSNASTCDDPNEFVNDPEPAPVDANSTEELSIPLLAKTGLDNGSCAVDAASNLAGTCNMNDKDGTAATNIVDSEGPTLVSRNNSSELIEARSMQLEEQAAKSRNPTVHANGGKGVKRKATHANGEKGVKRKTTHADSSVKPKSKYSHQSSSAASPQILTNPKAPRRQFRSDKLVTSRKSLADAGLAWQSGVRRSTRVKSRPLRHWLGERFLYARIHDSLTTVIGIKTYSPTADSKAPVAKVKSFVPSEYADLVEQVAKY